MEVQKFLKEHGIEELQKQFAIIVTDYPDRVVLNYNQIDSPRFIPLVDECRALILRKGTWEVMARSFDRFYNLGESVDPKEGIEVQRIANPGIKRTPTPNDTFYRKLNIANANIQEKLDGCCAEDTIIITDKGPKVIKELCESQGKTKVLAYDTTKEMLVWADVEAFSIKNNNDDWFEIELKNGKTIRLTSEHYVWLPELKCYRKVQELKEGDSIFLHE